MILEEFIEAYNIFVELANDDCGEEVFVPLKRKSRGRGDIFEVLYQANNKLDDSVLHFFVPFFSKREGDNIIGYNPLDGLYFYQSSTREIYASEDGRDKAYLCAPSSSVFIELLMLSLEIEQKYLEEVVDEEFRVEAYKKVFGVVKKDQKYASFCKLIIEI